MSAELELGSEVAKTSEISKRHEDQSNNNPKTKESFYLKTFFLIRIQNEITIRWKFFFANATSLGIHQQEKHGLRN